MSITAEHADEPNEGHTTPCGTSRDDAARFTNIKPTDNEAEREINISKGYLTILGALMYAIVFTRQDVAFHVSHLAGCMHSPSTEAYEALLGVMHYLYHTRCITPTY